VNFSAIDWWAVPTLLDFEELEEFFIALANLLSKTATFSASSAFSAISPEQFGHSILCAGFTMTPQH